MLHGNQISPYGNLEFYKYYLRPHINKIFDLNTKNKVMRNHKNQVFNLLKSLALNGPLTTWNVAKIRFSNDISKVRTKEKEYRRLLVGRIDRGKYSSGLVDLCLVVKDGKSENNKYADLYRLSLHGILYCLDVLGLTNKEIDIMAARYAQILPKVFGRWTFLKSILGEEVYNIKILAKGLLLDNKAINDTTILPIYELMSFINIKYHKYFEAISEENLADQITYWFYTNILYQQPTRNKNSFQKIKQVLDNDHELKKFYLDFVGEVNKYFKERFSRLEHFAIT